MEWVPHGPSGIVSSAHYGTLFNNRRSGPYQTPTIDFIPESDPRTIPPQPQPVSVGPTSLLGSWLGYFNNQSMTGDQIDELRKSHTIYDSRSMRSLLTTFHGTIVAGPDRPIPRTKTGSKDSKETGDKTGYSAGIDPRSLAANASSSASNLYNRLGNALSERGYEIPYFF